MYLKKCPKCGYDLKYRIEQVGIDMQNKPICNEWGYCDKCMSKYNLDSIKNESIYSNSKKSSLGIAGMIIGIIALLLSCILLGGLFGVVGLVISVVAIGNKNKKHSMTILGIVLNSVALLISIIMFFVIITSEDTTSSSDVENSTTSESIEMVKETPKPTNTPKPTAKPTAKPTEKPTPEPTATPEPVIDCTIDKCEIKYSGFELLEDKGGNDCVVVYYEFTNNSSENKEFSTVVTDKAFQNGIELENSIWKVEGYGENAYLEIKPGTTLTVACSYILRDKSDVELEIREWISFDNKPKAIMNIKIK